MHLRKHGLDKKEMFNTRIFDMVKGVEIGLSKHVEAVAEVFAFMGKGDSAYVKIPSNLLDTNGNPKKYYTFWLNLIDFKRKADYLTERALHYNQQIILDSLSIIDYIRNNDLHEWCSCGSGDCGRHGS